MVKLFTHTDLDGIGCSISAITTIATLRSALPAPATALTDGKDAGGGRNASTSGKQTAKSQPLGAVPHISMYFCIRPRPVPVRISQTEAAG